MNTNMNTNLFFAIVPLITILLLLINLLLAPHKPYKEKDSAFECGFHSFLGQNRMQFSISFFIFALLFLLFDLEIILVYPYVLTAYNNQSYGLIIIMIFFLLLTLGFAFELGKNALKIDSRQFNIKYNFLKQNKYILNSQINIYRIFMYFILNNPFKFIGFIKIIIFIVSMILLKGNIYLDFINLLLGYKSEFLINYLIKDPNHVPDPDHVPEPESDQEDSQQEDSQQGNSTTEDANASYERMQANLDRLLRMREDPNYIPRLDPYYTPRDITGERMADALNVDEGSSEQEESSEEESSSERESPSDEQSLPNQEQEQEQEQEQDSSDN